MKIWSMPHGDMGKYMNYNRPKVSKGRLLTCEEFAAPPVGDDGECSWLYAGKPGVSVWYSSVY